MAKKKPTSGHKRYRNAGIGQLVIEGNTIEPGDEFVAVLDPVFEGQMFMGGHLELVDDQPSVSETSGATPKSKRSRK